MQPDSSELLGNSTPTASHRKVTPHYERLEYDPVSKTPKADVVLLCVSCNKHSMGSAEQKHRGDAEKWAW